MAELTEPLVIIVGAVCEKCGKELYCPGYNLPEDSTALSPPVYSSAVRTSAAVHANEQGPWCGGRVLFATEPYECGGDDDHYPKLESCRGCGKRRIIAVPSGMCRVCGTCAALCERGEPVLIATEPMTE